MKKGKTFSEEYKAVTSLRVSEEDYCLELVHSNDWKTLAASSSEKKVTLMQAETLTDTLTLEPHTQQITGIRFSRSDPNILWSSSIDGSIKMWDLRTSQCEKELKGETEDSSVFKPITCFDISSNDRILCGGTELVEDGAFVLFWDIRGKDVLGSYYDSSTDDMCQIVFNPHHQDTLATASTDGIINVFDISQSSESDALTYSLNTEMVVSKLCWLSHGNKWERLGAATDMETFQYWDIKEAAPLHSFTRKKISKALKCDNPDESYVVSVTTFDESDDPVIIAGYHIKAESESESGSDETETEVQTQIQSDCLRTLRLDLSSGKLKPHGTFVARQPLLMTRTALYHSQTETFFTGGECGVVRMWRSERQTVKRKEPVAKKKKQRRSKPY